MRIVLPCLLLLPTPAFAVSVTFCVELNVDYSDNGFGEDYFTSDADQPARGLYAHITRTTAPVGDVWEGYLPYDGGSPGCHTATLTPNIHYSLTVASELEVNGNSVLIWASDEVQGPYGDTILPDYTAPSTTSTVTAEPAYDDWTNIAAAAGWALTRSNGGMTGKTYTFYTQECDGGGSCMSSSTGDIYLEASDATGGFGTNGGGADDKFAIIHELGHAVARAANGNNSANKNYDAACSSHGCCGIWDEGSHDYEGHAFDEIEYQSAAANEGIADFYAAIAFNTVSGGDCTFRYYKTVDWNQSGTEDTRTANCEGSPMTGVSAGDYIGDQCSGTLTNRGSQYDWLRFWWDMEEDHGMTTAVAFDIWDDANPQTWNATDSGFFYDMPAFRIAGACGANDMGDDWDDLASYEGVQR